MSIVRKAFNEGSWLAFFRFFSQTFSWVITIYIARILVPDDYGLMAISFIIVGYVERFSELGFGAAIIQKQKQTQDELSSMFWLSFGYSTILFIICFIAAYPAAILFKKPLVTPIMQLLSVTFVITGLQIVPSSLLRKKLEFKNFGAIELIVTVVSSSSMLVIANMGGGVWTLVSGHIIRSFVRLILIFKVSKWFPNFTFNISKTISYVKFGIMVTLSRTLFYITENSDTFVAGRIWSSNILGYYSFALQLSKIPMDKIISLVQQISFPLFSELQNNKDKIKNLYCDISKFIATIVFPLYVGGYLLGDELIRVLLDEKWTPMIFVFRYLCLVQIITPLVSINYPLHTAQGRPHWGLWYYGISSILMPVSFYFFVQHGLNAILVPWFTIYMIINSIWIITTIKKLEITLLYYLRALFTPFVATLFMAFAIQFFSSYSMLASYFELNMLVGILFKIVLGGIVYIGYLWFFDKEFFSMLRDLRNS